jgi:hypothetical protein
MSLLFSCLVRSLFASLFDASLFDAFLFKMMSLSYCSCPAVDLTSQIAQQSSMLSDRLTSHLVFLNMVGAACGPPRVLRCGLTSSDCTASAAGHLQVHALGLVKSCWVLFTFLFDASLFDASIFDASFLDASFFDASFFEMTSLSHCSCPAVDLTSSDRTVLYAG